MRRLIRTWANIVKQFALRHGCDEIVRLMNGEQRVVVGGVREWHYGLLLMSVRDQEPVIETIGMALGWIGQ